MSIFIDGKTIKQVMEAVKGLTEAMYALGENLTEVKEELAKLNGVAVRVEESAPQGGAPDDTLREAYDGTLQL